MKDGFYTIPEGFLDKVADQAARNAAGIRRRRYAALGALSAVCLFVAINLTQRTPQDRIGLDNLPDNELAEIAEIYQSDIFLNYNY